MTYRYWLGLDDFPARWHCGAWNDLLGWTHVLSDLSIWAAYFAIPLVLLYYARKRGQELPFPHLLPVFAVFILACGINHLIEAVIFWYPIYRVSAFVKLFTALVSWFAVYVLIGLTPEILSYPSPERMRVEIEERTAELTRSNEALQAFVFTASHDMKTPIRGMRNLAQFVIEDTEGKLDPESTKNLEKIIQRAHQLTSLLKNLVEYSRVSYQQGKSTEVDVRKFVASLADLMDIPPSFEVKFASEMPIVYTDKGALALVLRNLIGNAHKHHHREEGTITFDWRDEGDFHRFTVTDDGPGIPEEYQSVVFEPFKKFNRKSSDGLGLALVKKAVEEAGGEVFLKSVVGEGSSFSFTWPKWKGAN